MKEYLKKGLVQVATRANYGTQISHAVRNDKRETIGQLRCLRAILALFDSRLKNARNDKGRTIVY